jgi:hypothetical protein
LSSLMTYINATNNLVNPMAIFLLRMTLPYHGKKMHLTSWDLGSISLLHW